MAISHGAMDLIGGMLTSQPKLRLTGDECLKHAWIRHTL